MPYKIIITQSLIREMRRSATFKMQEVSILVSNEAATTTITLSLAKGEEFPISGFPRALLAKEDSKGNLAHSICREYRRLIVPT